MKQAFCPGCKISLQASDVVVGPPCEPSPGDVSVCLHCGHLGVWDDDLGLREPTDAELVEIAGNVVLAHAQKHRLELLAMLEAGRVGEAS